MTGRTQRDEEWREIPGLLGYEASSEGRIRRTVAVGRYGANHVLSQNVSEPGYPRVNLQLLVHGLVARAFLGTRPKGRFINHKDGNKRNAAADNLEYVTPSDNAVHAYTLGLQPCGERHGRARLTDAQVAEIRTQYGGLAGNKAVWQKCTAFLRGSSAKLFVERYGRIYRLGRSSGAMRGIFEVKYTCLRLSPIRWGSPHCWASARFSSRDDKRRMTAVAPVERTA